MGVVEHEAADVQCPPIRNDSFGDCRDADCLAGDDCSHVGSVPLMVQSSKVEPGECLRTLGRDCLLVAMQRGQIDSIGEYLDISIWHRCPHVTVGNAHFGLPAAGGVHLRYISNKAAQSNVFDTEQMPDVPCDRIDTDRRKTS